MEMRLFYYVAVMLIIKVIQINATRVTCESVDYEVELGTPTTCFLNGESTTINSDETTIFAATGSDVRSMFLASNKNIFFLPVNISESFQNLLILDASDCSLTKIAKINFSYLGKLLTLNLNSNQIEKIPDNTFKDLKSLQWLHLRE